MNETTIHLRQTSDATDSSMAQYESPDADAICASYVSQQIAGSLGEYAELEIESDEAAVPLKLDGVSGANDDGNYAVYDTPGGNLTGVYISHEALAEVHGNEASPENAPESVNVALSPSSEDEFEEAAGSDEPDENEADALLSGTSEDSDSDDEQEVEVSDEELNLVNE